MKKKEHTEYHHHYKGKKSLLFALGHKIWSHLVVGPYIPLAPPPNGRGGGLVGCLYHVHFVVDVHTPIACFVRGRGGCFVGVAPLFVALGFGLVGVVDVAIVWGVGVLQLAPRYCCCLAFGVATHRIVVELQRLVAYDLLVLRGKMQLQN